MVDVFGIPGIDIKNIGISPGANPESAQAVINQVANVIGEIASGELEIVELGD